MNKRGTDKILSIYWFVILIIAAGGISAMVYNFYSYPYDVRSLESKVLSDKLSDCISQGGILNSGLFDSSGKLIENQDKSILQFCSLNFAPESSFNNEEQFYFEINFYNISNQQKLLLEIQHGNSAWKADCEISKDKDYTNLVQCYNNSFYSLDSSGKSYLIKILTTTRKTEKNVK
jgi:hypothetical protein